MKKNVDAGTFVKFLTKLANDEMNSLPDYGRLDTPRNYAGFLKERMAQLGDKVARSLPSSPKTERKFDAAEESDFPTLKLREKYWFF